MWRDWVWCLVQPSLLTSSSRPEISFQIRTQQHSHPEGTVSELRYKIFYRVCSPMMIFKCINASVLSTSFEFHQSRTKSCDGFLQLLSPYCGWCWQIQDWQELDILHRAAPDRASRVWAAKYSGFYYNISNSVFFYSVSVINILYGPSGSEERLNTMSILTFEDCSSGAGWLMLQWFRLRNGINFIRHVALWHVIQRHVPANYKAVTTQMTEEIFVSTFIIGKRTGELKISG